jgi:hypothetical protein
VVISASNSALKKDSDPTLQGCPRAPFPGHRQKSAFAQPINLTEVGAVNPAGCDMAQNSKIAPMEITLQSEAQ